MKLFSKLSLNPEDPAAVLSAIEYALDIGLWLKPSDLLLNHVQERVKEIDHIGFAASIKALPSILRYQKEHQYSLRSFKSTIASQEFKNEITIYELKGSSLPLELMVPTDSSKEYPQHHIAFSVREEEDLKSIISLFHGTMTLPSFMEGPLKNQKEKVSMIYLDGGPVRIEFIYKSPFL